MEKAVFDELSRIVYEKSGISLTDRKMALVASRLSSRLRATGLKSSAEYLEYLKKDEAEEELVDFLNVISTNVTNFFREPSHFDDMLKVMNEWLDKGQRKFRLWSAACSSGEEPYTIAMTLLEHLPCHKLDIKILATDISTNVLHFAKNGVYPESRVKDVPPDFLSSYFCPAIPHGNSEKAYSVSFKLKKMVEFKRLNLSEHPFPIDETFDIIFCRNVMIYFDRHVKEKLVEDFSRLLRPQGLLMISHSESLSSIKHQLSLIRPSVYLKP